MANNINDKDFLPESAVYTPAEFSTYGLQAIEKARQLSSFGMPLGIETLDEYFAPLLPGQVAGVIAQTSNYKSGFLHFIAHNMAKKISTEKRENSIIIHVSVEEGIEEQAFLEFARVSGENPGNMARGRVQDWSRLQAAAITVAGIPIFHIGESLARADDMPNLYLSNMIRSINTLVNGSILEYKPTIAGLFFDYLQAFPIDPEVKGATQEQQRRLQVRNDIYRIRQAAKYFNCPTWVAIQAKQNLTGAKPPMYLPGIYDGEETSAIAQRLDRVITLWLPKMNYPVGSLVNGGNFSFVVDENLCFVKVAKQRGGLPSGKTFSTRIDYTKNTIEVDPKILIAGSQE